MPYCRFLGDVCCECDHKQRSGRSNPKRQHGGWRVVLCIALPRNRGCVGQASHQPVEVQVTLKNCLLSNTAFGAGGHHNRYAKSFATIESRRSGNKKSHPEGQLTGQTRGNASEVGVKPQNALCKQSVQHVGKPNMCNSADYAATVATSSSRTTRVVTPFPAVSMATPLLNRPVAGMLMFFAVLSPAIREPIGKIAVLAVDS